MHVVSAAAAVNAAVAAIVADATGAVGAAYAAGNAGAAAALDAVDTVTPSDLKCSWLPTDSRWHEQLATGKWQLAAGTSRR